MVIIIVPITTKIFNPRFSRECR